MFLCDVVEVNICDWIIASESQVEVEVLCTIQVDPILSVRVVIGYCIGLEHLRLQLLLLEKKLFHDLLAYVDSV